MTSASTQIHRGQLLHFLDDPQSNPEACQYFHDGALLVSDGHIEAAGQAANIIGNAAAEIPVVHHRNALIVPGFVDCHVHYPQYNVIAAYGTQLLDWLNTHTFPEEEKFSDRTYAAQVAELFLDELLANGTTTALVFATVHPESVDAFFAAAEARDLRMICGKVMMDRNAPASLCRPVEQSVAESEALIKQWHGKKRLGYAVTPRFAPTSSAAELQAAAELRSRHPDTLLHTHLAENDSECGWVQTLFPEARSYVDVYQRFGLLGQRSVFAHAIHLDETDWQCMQHSDSVIAHCPMSNLFIGSGLFDMQQATEHNIRFGFGTDVGGGDSFSILRTINEAYKVQQLQGQNLSPLRSLYLATLGGARALSLDKKIGNFEKGKEADFNILDFKGTRLIANRLASNRLASNTPEASASNAGSETATRNTEGRLLEKLFVLQMLGDDRCIRQTWVMGKSVKQTS